MPRVDGIGAALRDEFGGTHPRLLAARLVLAPLPRYTGARIRARVLRAAGFDVARNAVFCDMPIIRGGSNLCRLLHVGDNVFVNVGCVFDLNERIDIGDNVQLAHEVLLLTTTHEIGPPQVRAGKHVIAPVRIGRGAWLGARSTILPGVTVGEGAVVGAGSVVTKDVAPHTVVGGVPARVIVEHLPQ